VHFLRYCWGQSVEWGLFPLPSMGFCLSASRWSCPLLVLGLQPGTCPKHLRSIRITRSTGISTERVWVSYGIQHGIEPCFSPSLASHGFGLWVLFFSHKSETIARSF